VDAEDAAREAGAAAFMAEFTEYWRADAASVGPRRLQPTPCWDTWDMVHGVDFTPRRETLNAIESQLAL